MLKLSKHTVIEKCYHVLLNITFDIRDFFLVVMKVLVEEIEKLQETKHACYILRQQQHLNIYLDLSKFSAVRSTWDQFLWILWTDLNTCSVIFFLPSHKLLLEQSSFLLHSGIFRLWFILFKRWLKSFHSVRQRLWWCWCGISDVHEWLWVLISRWAARLSAIKGNKKKLYNTFFVRQ